jgi:hypothetical protein
LAVTRTAAAQTRILDPGARVRVRMDRQTMRFVGQIAGTRPDSLVLNVPLLSMERWTVPVSDIAELDVSAGRRRLTLVGLGVGAAAGILVTASYNGIVQSQCFSDCPKRASVLIGATVGSIVLGTGLYFVRAERWLRIPLPNRARRQPGEAPS